MSKPTGEAEKYRAEKYRAEKYRAFFVWETDTLHSDKGANPNKRRLRYLTKKRSHAFSMSETAVFPLTLCRIAAPGKEDYTSPPDTAQRNYRIPESQEAIRLPDRLGITV